jgi:tRNA nucleotidyltransferase (CCA-adding enzyme)
VPAAHRELAIMACREHLNVHRLDELRDATVLELLTRCDAFRKPERIAQLALVCEADKRGRLGSEDADYRQGRELQRLHAAVRAVNARDLDEDQLAGPEIGLALKKARLLALQKARRSAR